MSLSSIQLDAFAAVARTLHFSRAAKQLHITQSALSQRVANLESELGLSLFSRGAAGVQLTDAGTQLMRYCQTKDQLESEALADLVSGSKGELAGIVRVASYSSIARSVLLPRIAPLLRESPRVQIQLSIHETQDLPAVLTRGEAEFVVLDREITRAGIETRKIGEEVYVVIESTRHPGREGVYLDHDPDDSMTLEFLKVAGDKSRVQRSFLGDVYGILDGVAEGLGRAVMSEHLLAGRKDIRVVKGAKSLEFPVVLHYQRQPFYTRLHQAALAALTGR